MTYFIKSILFALLAVSLISSCAVPAPAAAPTPLPTSTLTPIPPVTPTIPVANPAEVVQEFWDALNAQDLDAAMALVADDIQLRGAGYVNTKEALQSIVQGILKNEHVYEMGDLVVEGDTVNYAYDIYDAGVLRASGIQEVMRVENGKIVYWEIQ